MTKKRIYLNILLAVIFSMSFLFLPLMTGINSRTNNSIYAATNSTKVLDATSSVGLSNANFSSGSGSTSAPQTPSSWTKADGSGVTPEYVGIINMGSSYFNNNKANYGLDSYNMTTNFFYAPDETDTKILFLNSPTSATHYGYTNSSEFTLNADSFYEIKMLVYTYGEASASVYLAGNNFDASASITDIVTGESWQNISLFVKTSDINSSPAKLELFLGKKNGGNCSGFVCFDNISVMQYSQDEYFIHKADTANYKEIDLTTTQNVITDGDYGFVKNGTFATDLTYWTNSNARFVADFDTPCSINGETITIGTSQRQLKSGALLIANNNTASMQSSEFSIKRMSLYRISVWAKHAITQGEAKLGIYGMPNSETTLTPEEKSATISSLVQGSALNNYWTRYDFYVRGDSRFDTTGYLKFELGNTDSTATGYLAIGDIKTEILTDEQKSNSSSTNSNNTTLTMQTSADLSFANSTFNNVVIGNSSVYEPEDWTAENSDNTESGVVNVLPENWDAVGADIVCPTKTSSDNVLMIRNSNTESYQAYTSESVALSASEYARISFEAFTQVNSGQAYATIASDNGGILYEFALPNLNSWNTYDLLIKNFNTDQNLTIMLSLGKEDAPATGYAFFDNVTFDSSIEESTFEDALENERTVKINLADDQIIANDNGIPRYMTEVTNTAEAQYGIIKADEFNFGVNKNSITTHSDNNDEIFYIYSKTDTNTSLKTNFAYTFNANTYYKVSVWIKTVNIPQSDEFLYDDNGETVKAGAMFKVEGVNKYFTGINTNKSEKTQALTEAFADSSNEWTQYIIYINQEDSVSGSIVFGLGNDFIKSSGYAFFEGLEVKSISEDEFKSQTATYENELPTNILLATPDEDEEDSTADASSGFDSSAWFAIPTAIIGVAVIVAIIGYFIRKAKSNRPRQKEQLSEADYSRLNTLLKDVEKKERKTEIKHKITLLKEELKQSKQYLIQEQEELGKTSDPENPVDIKQVEKSIEMQKNKISEIELDLKVLEAEYEKIVSKQKKNK